MFCGAVISFSDTDAQAVSSSVNAQTFKSGGAVSFPVELTALEPGCDLTADYFLLLLLPRQSVALAAVLLVVFLSGSVDKNIDESVIDSKSSFQVDDYGGMSEYPSAVMEESGTVYPVSEESTIKKYIRCNLSVYFAVSSSGGLDAVNGRTYYGKNTR